MLYSKNETVDAQAVTSIEGQSASGTFVVKPMLSGEKVSLLEVRVRRGTVSSMHAHSHESLIYVVSGALKTIIGEQHYVLGPGDVCRHPEQVMHSVEALEDTVFVEVKSPIPALSTTLGI
jgi:quercetin dioxygenase-like cupin family protein